MKKFEIVYISFFIQIAFVLVAWTQIQEGRYLVTPAIDNVFLGSIGGLNSRLETINVLFYNLQQNGLFGKSVAFLGVELPNIFALAIRLWEFLSVFGLTIILIFINAIIFSGFFYSAIMVSLLPNSQNSAFYAFLIGSFIGLGQTLIIFLDLAKSIKGATVATIGFFFDLDDATGGTLGRKIKERGK